MAKSALASRRGSQCFFWEKLCPANRCDDNLGDPHTRGDDERPLTVVDENDTKLSSIIGVDGARRVEDGDPVFESKAAAGPNLDFKTFWDAEFEPCGDQSALARL